nr:PREDICTED: hyaluronan and proteoglycan link protein 3 [Opisthocomus hoazin]
MLATFNQLFQYPIRLPRKPCGGVHLAPGIRSYGPRHRHLHRFDAFCFSSALRGEVFYLDHPAGMTLEEGPASPGCASAKLPCPRHQADLEEAEPCGPLPPHPPRAGRRCLHTPGMDHHLPQPIRPEQFMPAMLLLLACSAPPVPRDCGQSPLWNVGQGMALLPGHCVFIGALALGITGSHQPQQGTLLPAAHPSKLGATLAAGTSQKRGSHHPFYNGFYYNHIMNDKGNGQEKVAHFNGARLVVETPKDPIYSFSGANVTLPCHYSYEPDMESKRKIRIKWSKLRDDYTKEQDVLVAIGKTYMAFGKFQGRAYLHQTGRREASLVVSDVRLQDDGKYRCEVIDGLEDESNVVDLRLQGVLWPHQPRPCTPDHGLVPVPQLDLGWVGDPSSSCWGRTRGGHEDNWNRTVSKNAEI